MNRPAIAIIATSCLLAACASYETVEQGPSAEAVNQQISVLMGWKKGMDISDMQGEIAWHIDWSYQTIEANGTWKFYYIHNLATYGSFGLLFHNDRLDSMVASTDGRHVVDCLTPYNLSGQHWLTHGLAPYEDWLVARAIFGDPQALASSGKSIVFAHDTKLDQSKRNFDQAAGNAMAAIVYAPFLLVYAPFAASENQTRNAQQNFVDSEAAFEQSIKLGQTAPQQAKYPADTQFDINGIHVLQYNVGSFAYGVRDGDVVMIESPAMLELYARFQRAQMNTDEFKRQDCASLRGQ